MGLKNYIDRYHHILEQMVPKINFRWVPSVSIITTIQYLSFLNH